MNNQMNNAVRKIHNLLSSGAVTVTGPNQPRILKQKIVGSGSGSGTNVTGGNTTVATGNSIQHLVTSATSANINRCYVCDDALGANQAQNQLTEMQTSHTSTKFPNKIGQLVGDSFMVIVSVEDVVCARCTNLINYLDRLENDVERVRTNLMNLLNKKYGLNDDGGGATASPTAPPNKLQKLNSGAAVSAVQQMKISTHSPTTVQQHSAGTQTLQRKTTKIYKCLSCEYKTSDMRLFNTHYETCKHQNFQCKNCKKIFPNFGAMKQHMVREHNTPMDNTCAVCHINFASEAALRKHMELNHSTNVVVTSTTTVPVAQVAVPAVDPITSGTATVTTTPLYTCTHCQFKSTDKAMFDEHMRKHIAGVKSKPFKCRLCAQRFETREAATTHAKQHQGNVFKCGTCSMSFSKRELLVKHFEIHQQDTQVQQQQQTHQQNVNQQQQQVVAVKQQIAPPTSSQNLLTTQKLLQETIDEALSETTSTPVTTSSTGDVGGATSANNIRFFSCHICSLTFIQENYYNQHMETHQRGDANMKKNSNSNNTMSALNAAALLSEAAQLDANSAELTVQQQQAGGTVNATGNCTIESGLEADIESIFEKMHSDKGESTATTTTSSGTTTAAGGSSDQVVITSQAGSGGGITFNITIPGQEGGGSASGGDDQHRRQAQQSTPTTSAPVSVSIDMPMLDQPDETTHAPTTTTNNTTTTAISKSQGDVKPSISGPVSMPSLDDDNEEPSSVSVPTTTANDLSQDVKPNVQSIVKIENSPKSLGGENIKVEAEEQNNENQSETSSHEVSANTASENSAVSQHNNSSTADETVTETGEGATHEQLAAAVAAAGEQQQVALELDEATMQAQVDGGQIKFILNESGQLLQLDNHIITDADGNQILVQDPEQIQQLLQSVGVLQPGDGLDGETLQMMTDANGQMVLVQGENNETQLIDASLLNAEGQLVIQQSQDGEGGAHVIGEDGTRIPVSVSYTEDGQPIVQVQHQVLEAAAAADGGLEKDGSGAEENAQTDEAGQHVIATTTASGTSSGGFFALEELIQQSSSTSASTAAAGAEAKRAD
uniref:C2H2-type domain-containing protein n=1 Tax=Glossina pallidipes TaxID=7398 RepID=A0A1A9Z3J3_GLOPL